MEARLLRQVAARLLRPLQPDGWAVSTAAHLLDLCQPRAGDVLYDPFVGSGASLLAARARGLHAVGVDVDPLSVTISRAVMETPTYPPLEAARGLLETRGFNGLLDAARAAVEGEGAHRDTLVFLAVASLTRVGWPEGGELNEPRVRAEAAQLVAGLLATAQDAEPRSHARARVFHEDALAPSPARLAALARRRIVLVTSPPFFGSIPSPRRAQLSDRLGLPTMKPLVDHANPEAYGQFLEAVVAHARFIGCDAIAIETGPGQPSHPGVDWRAHLRRALDAHRFDVHEEIASPDSPEDAVALIARSRGATLGAPSG